MVNKYVLISLSEIIFWSESASFCDFQWEIGIFKDLQAKIVSEIKETELLEDFTPSLLPYHKKTKWRNLFKITMENLIVSDCSNNHLKFIHINENQILYKIIYE